MNINKFMNPKFCYWIGLAQSDGCLKEVFLKKINYVRYSIDIASKDVILLKTFQRISNKFLKRNGTIWYEKRTDTNVFRACVKRILHLFPKLDIDFTDPPKPPKWLTKNKKLFGAYLAGIIDGDGDIRTKRPKYPQCVIRIASGKFQEEFCEAIKILLSCRCGITRRYRETALNDRKISGTSYALEFYVSRKNMDLIKKYVLPWILLSRKREKLSNFIKEKWARGDLNS